MATGLGQSDHQQAHDAQHEEERRRGEAAQRQAPPRRRVGADGGQVDRNQRGRHAFLRDEIAAARRPEHVARGVRADAGAARMAAAARRDEPGERKRRRRSRDRAGRRRRTRAGRPAVRTAKRRHERGAATRGPRIRGANSVVGLACAADRRSGSTRTRIRQSRA